MKHQYPLYPEISINKEVFHARMHKVILTTTVRVLNEPDGLWYKVLLKDDYVLDSEIALFEHFSRFHRLVYHTQLFYKVDTTLLNEAGEPSYRPDNDQRTEQERLYSLIKH